MTDITLLDGLLGGLLATIVMTALMNAVGDDSPPPTSVFWSKYIGDNQPAVYLVQGLVLHFLYGLGASVVFAGVLLGAGFDPIELFEAIGAGLGYGFVLFVVAAGFWMNLVLDFEPEPRDITQFLFFHLVYGAILGAVVGLGPIGVELV